ncbi:MAG: hypothetical protein GX111_12545 [Clostridiales bacterium]|jgi:hypothetical protein|nr:hypothetical protein [Clostridiales bacterium]
MNGLNPWSSASDGHERSRGSGHVKKKYFTLNGAARAQGSDGPYMKGGAVITSPRKYYAAAPIRVTGYH